jgi:hypothetical protein
MSSERRTSNSNEVLLDPLCNEDGLNDLLAIHPQFRLQLLLAIFTDLGRTGSARSLDVQRQTVLRYVSDGATASS